MPGPSGTVTFVFTNVVGSTRLWEAAPESMRLALARYDGIVRKAVDAHGGYGFATGGDLAAVDDPAAVATQVASVFALKEGPGMSATGALAAYLGDKRALLILDNCEHVLDAAAALADALLSSCPQLRLLATSRQPLNLPGELTWRVPCLEVPGDVGQQPLARRPVRFRGERDRTGADPRRPRRQRSSGWLTHPHPVQPGPADPGPGPRKHVQSQRHLYTSRPHRWSGPPGSA